MIAQTNLADKFPFQVDFGILSRMTETLGDREGWLIF